MGRCGWVLQNFISFITKLDQEIGIIPSWKRIWFYCSLHKKGHVVEPWSLSNDCLATLDRPNWMELLVMAIGWKTFWTESPRVFFFLIYLLYNDSTHT